MSDRSSASEADPSPVDLDNSDRTNVQSTETDATGLTGETLLSADDHVLSDPKALLLAKLGHRPDSDDLPEDLINLYLKGAQAFEDGDNRTASIALQHLLLKDPPEKLREEAMTLRGRISPDRFALLVVLVCAMGLALVWVLAVSG